MGFLILEEMIHYEFNAFFKWIVSENKSMFYEITKKVKFVIIVSVK